jgi:hypothetical protein
MAAADRPLPHSPEGVRAAYSIRAISVPTS